MQRINTLVLPKGAHFDPIVACWLLFRYGQDKFPGIENAELAIRATSESLTEREKEEWKKQGKLGIDIGGGEFDHHDKEASSATYLVAKFLGIADNPELQMLLEYVKQDELAGLHNRYGELPSIVKAMNNSGKSLPEIINAIFPLIDVLQKQEKEYHIIAAKEFRQKAKVFKIKYRGKTIKIAAINSDHHLIARFARFHSIALTIQKRSTGHVMLSTNKAKRVDLRPVIKAIRLAELRLNGKEKEVEKISPYTLIKEGSIPQVSHWYYHKGLASIFNGTDLMTATPPTALSLEQIVDICVKALADD